MLSEYVNTALQKAEYRKLEDRTWFAEIPGFDGVWANGESVEACRSELIEVLEDWILLKVKDQDPLPQIGVELIKRPHAG
jgi:predicted RNase H-like HicB family nuclease